MELRLLILPVVGGIIGWFTNYLAVKMLFRPRKAYNFFGLQVQGLIPKRRTEIAQSIGEVVEQELVSHSDLEAVLADPGFLEGLRPRIREQIDLFLHRRVVRDNTFLRAAFATSAGVKLKERIVEELMNSLPDMVESMTDELKGKFQFRQIVESKIEAFELDRLEAIVTRVAQRELSSIEILGGVLGFIIGLIQMGIVVALK